MPGVAGAGRSVHVFLTFNLFFMHVILAGSRSFGCYTTFSIVCNHYLQHVPNPVIVSGHAKGADSLALQYANEKGWLVRSFLPNWAKYGKAAGVIRNQQMAQHSQALIAFWNGKSPGTKNMLSVAKKQGLAVRVFYFNGLFTELGPPL